MRWTKEIAAGARPSAWGFAFIAMGAVTQLAGGFYRINSVEGLAFLPYLGGIVLLLGGWPMLRCAWPAIAFLVFMIPLPWRFEEVLGEPLQYLATMASTYTLQTLGFMAFAVGNVIHLDGARIGVVEACSGLSALITFIALSTGIAMMVERPLIDRVVLVLSAIPVALIANIARITMTGVLHETAGGSVADRFYDDLAGWVMIPLALVLYRCVTWVFSHTLVEVEAADSVVGVPAGVRETASRGRHGGAEIDPAVRARRSRLAAMLSPAGESNQVSP
jgi:exosortase